MLLYLMYLMVEEIKKFKHSKIFVPGGQSTQLIVGATSESDYKILNLSSYEVVDKSRFEELITTENNLNM